MMDFRILGELEVWKNGRLVHVGGPRHRRLLAVLLLACNRVVPRDHLVQVLWPSKPPANATAIIHVRVSELRKSLGRSSDESSPILTTDHGYRLHVDSEDLDSFRFQSRAESGHRALASSHFEAAVDTLSDAIKLWRGPAYVDIKDDPGAEPEIARLEAMRTGVEDDLLEARLQLGENTTVAAELSALVVQTPWAERRWALLMLALYRSGRQGEALATFGLARDRLIDDLGIEPGAELRRMHDDILNQDVGLELTASTPAPSSGSRSSSKDPPRRLSTFVGRESDLEAAARLLLDSRLVTISGPGGVGKTSLALELAAQSPARYPGGVWFVELASIDDPALVATTVAMRLGVREQPGSDLVLQISERIGPSPCLLILDNCEHLLDPLSGVLAQLLQHTGQLTVLATSRERLGMSGERVHQLGGLGLPADGRDHQPNEVGLSEAAQLLVERATAVRSDFRLDARTAPHIAKICRRLDGLPLAIELAAAVTSALDVEQIAVRLHDRLELLSGGIRSTDARHASLRSVVDWSYTRLTPDEQRVFEQISVFHGPFTLQSAEEVCRGASDDVSVAVLLWRLVDKSLLNSETVDSDRRYRLLEVVKEYALQRLSDRGDLATFRERHALHFLRFAETAGAALRGPEQAYWVAALEREHSNLRAAMEWFIENGQGESVTRLAGSIYAFWDRQGHYDEGRRWLTRALAFPDDVGPGPRARALMGSATLAVIQGDLRSAEAICTEVIALSRTNADYEALSHALQFLGLAAIFANELDTADAVFSESLRAARFAGQVWLEGWALEFQAAVALARTCYDETIELAQQSLRSSRSDGDPECAAFALVTMSTAYIATGRIAAAVAPLRESLASFRGLGGSWGLSLAIFDCAQVAGQQGDLSSATRLLGSSEQLRVSARAGMLPSIQSAFDHWCASCSAALGPTAYAKEWSAGHDETIEQTLSRAEDVLAAFALREARH